MDYEKQKVTKEKRIESRATISGTIDHEFEYSHDGPTGERFYTTTIRSKRKSGVEDNIPIIVSEYLIAILGEVLPGDKVYVEGQLRSFDLKDECKTATKIFVFAKEIYVIPEVIKDENTFYFGECFLCKEPELRKTWVSRRDIADINVAVNRKFGKSDYFPCIVWGRLAKYISIFPVGTQINNMTGRIQSREYLKILEGKTETKVTLELSVNLLEVVKERK